MWAAAKLKESILEQGLHSESALSSLQALRVVFQQYTVHGKLETEWFQDFFSSTSSLIYFSLSLDELFEASTQLGVVKENVNIKTDFGMSTE